MFNPIAIFEYSQLTETITGPIVTSANFIFWVIYVIELDLNYYIHIAMNDLL